MLDLLKWLIAFVGLTPVGCAVMVLAFGELRAHDYLIAKFVGLIAVSAALWVAGYLMVPLLSPIGLDGALLFACGISFWVLKRRGIRMDRRAWGLAEAAFVGLVVTFVFVKGFNPTVLDGEKPMDMMLLSSAMRARSLPPEDAWLAGRSVNYYYYGFFAFGSVAKAVWVSSFVAFSMGLATIWGASLLLLHHIGLSAMGSWRKALAFPVLYGFVGNLGALYQVIQNPRAIGWSFDWWNPSRAVPDAITEFPAFSYIFGDFHAHMMGVMWLGVFVVVLQRCASSPDASREAEGRAGTLPTLGIGLLLGVVCGELLATNSWSLFAVVAVGVASLALWSPRPLTLVGLLLGFAMIFAPYAFHNHPPAISVQLVAQTSPLAGWSVHWLVLASAVYWSFVVRPRDPFIVAVASAGILLVAIPEVIVVRAFYEGRINTVFKLWWDAWFLLSIAGAYGLVRLAELGKAGRGLASAHFFAGGLYLPLAVPARCGFFAHWYGSDPATFVFMRHPSLRRPYDRLVREQPPAFYEPSADSYTENCLLSAFTGVPTIVGWQWHEIAWRDRDPEVLRRIAIANEVRVHGLSPALAKNFHIKYVYADGRLRPVRANAGILAR